MAIYDAVSQKLLENLLDEIHSGSAGLPDFQRSYVWDPDDTVNLISSIARHYPAGSILTVGNANNYFVTRKFEKAPDDGHKPKYLVLDGQQRLTSLYQAFFGCGEFLYYLDIDLLLEGRDLADGEVIKFQKATKKIEGKPFLEVMDSDFSYQARNRVMPLSVIFGPGKNFNKWEKKFIKEVPEDEREEISRQMEQIDEEFVSKIDKYMFPVVSLNSSTSIASLCTIFETLNRRGQKLTTFELLTARFWKDGINLRTLWDKAVDDYPELTDYDIQPYQLVQCISMITYPSASCKREDVLNLKATDINENWDLALESMIYGLEILNQDCKILNSKWLPTSGMLGPLAAVLAIGKSFPKASKGVRRSQVVRWLWCSIFSQRYEAAANTRGEKDVNEMRTWFEDSSKTPEAIAQFVFDPQTLRFISSKNNGVYKGVICLTLKTNGGSLDFVTGAAIPHQMVTSGEVDDHHIFPKKYLSDVKQIKDKSLINCVINRTLIDRETNKSISAKAPSDYIMNLKAPNIAQVLESHLIPHGPKGPLESNDYEAFIEQRTQLIFNKIREVTI
jgi:hypothetical protein